MAIKPVLTPANWTVTLGVGGFGADDAVGQISSKNYPTSFKIVSGNSLGFFTVTAKGQVRTVKTKAPKAATYKLGITGSNSAGTSAVAYFGITVKAAAVSPPPPPPPPPPPQEDDVIIGVTSGAPAAGRIIPASFFGMHMLNGTDTTAFTIGRYAKPSAPRWPAVELTAGNYTWTAMDAVMDRVQALGLTELMWSPMASDNPVPEFYQDGDNPWVTDFSKVTNFVAAAKARYTSRNPTITLYFEVFNEAYYKGVTPAKLVEYANATVAGVGGSLVVGPDMYGRGSWPDYFDDYWTLGGPKNIRALSLHGYPMFAQNDGQNVPESIEDGWAGTHATYETLRSIISAHGLGSLPIWDTEVSWGTVTDYIGSLNNQDIEAAWVARCFLAHMPRFERCDWYAFPSAGSHWGRLEGRKGDVAVREVMDWAVGAKFQSYTVTGSVRKVAFGRDAPSGYRAWAVWDFGSGNGFTGSSSYTVPTGMIRYRDLDGNVTATNAGVSVTIGSKPLFFESHAI